LNTRKQLKQGSVPAFHFILHKPVVFIRKNRSGGVPSAEHIILTKSVQMGVHGGTKHAGDAQDSNTAHFGGA